MAHDDLVRGRGQNRNVGGVRNAPVGGGGERSEGFQYGETLNVAKCKILSQILLFGSPISSAHGRREYALPIASDYLAYRDRPGGILPFWGVYDK